MISMLVSHMAWANDWVLAKEKDRISVYTKESMEFSIKEFKAVTILDAKLEEVLSVLSNFDSYAAWYDHCKEAHEVDKGLADRTVFQMEMSMPFPFSNSDMVAEFLVCESKKKTDVQIVRKSNVVKEKEDVVRMPVSDGSWSLIAIDSDHTKVIHQFRGDPAGNIPTSIVNMFIVAGPINTLTRLKEYLVEQ